MNKIKETLNEYVCNKDRVMYNINKKSMLTKRNTYIRFATSFIIIFIIVAIGAIFFNRPVAYVSIDINPSFILQTNALDRIIKVEALNNDSQAITENLNLYGKDISSGIDEIIDSSSELGYISTEDENAILVSTYCDNTQKRDKMQNKIHNNLSNSLNKKGINVKIIDSELSEEEAIITNRYGVSQAKINLIEKAIEQNPNLKYEDLINLPIREIVTYIEEYNDVEYTNNSQNNNGNGKQNGRK